MTLYLDQLQQQLDKVEFSECRSMTAFCVINNQLQVFIDSRFTEEYDHESQMMKKCFANYTGIEVDEFRETLIQLMENVMKHIEERTPNKLKYDDMVKYDDKENACQVKLCDGVIDLGKIQMLDQFSLNAKDQRLISFTLLAAQ